MNYFLKYLINDKRMWVKLLIIVMITLSIIDLLSYSFQSPGIFNLWILKITLILFSSALLIFAFKGSLKEKKLKKIKSDSKIFERIKEKEIRNIVGKDPDFNTFCFECIYFNSETKGCRRDRIFEPVKEIKIGYKTYCLYWQKNINSNS